MQWHRLELRHLGGALLVLFTLAACERRGGAGTGETGSTETPPGYSGMERDTSVAGDTAGGHRSEMDSFRLKQETGQDTGGTSGIEQPAEGGGTGQGQQQ